MALGKYARRFGFGGQSDSLTPAEAGFYTTAQQLADFADGRRCVLKFARIAPSGLREDAEQFDFEFVNFTGGVIDNTWVDADYVALETMVLTWYTSVKVYMHPNVVLDQLRWFKFGPGLPLSEKGNEIPGPPTRVLETNAPGTSASNPPWPAQVAVSITLKTPIRKRWGRIYVPGMTANTSDTFGRVTAGVRGVLADATDTLVASATSSDFAPVVYSPTQRAAHGITEIQVDDIFDVIRSRRPNETGARTVRNT